MALIIDFTTEFGQRVLRPLQKEEVVWLTTVTSEGVPQPTPVWFWWDEETVLIYSQPGKPKLHNIEQNPTVALHFNCDFAGHEITIFTGTARNRFGFAVLDPHAPPPHHHPDYLEKYRTGIANINMTPESMGTAYHAAIRVTPTHLRGY
jgi:PPOX class probable F420-dependent enzyme